MMTNLSSCMDSKSDAIRKGIDKLVALEHHTLPHPHSCLTCVRPLPQHPPSPSLVFNVCEASLPQSPSHINLIGFLVTHRPSLLMFNAFEALRRPLSSSTVVAHHRHPPSLPTFITRCCFPPSLPTIVAHRCCPPLLPTIVAHRWCPPLSPTIVAHHCHPPLSPPLPILTPHT